MIKNVNAYYHSNRLTEGKSQKKYLKNIVKPEKMCEITWVMNVMQKDRYFGEILSNKADFLSLMQKFGIHVM